MPATRHTIRFLLNDERIETADIGADETLLDWLRLRRSLRGTKEGCAEGDCGACTVLVGRLAGDALRYESVNACIRFMASLDGCHVVTVEHLSGTGDGLHPVQQAMVDYHGSQCGFCTPGFVMSLYALWMREPSPSDAAIEKALQGNLCRCTGYESIMRSGRAISSYGDAGKDAVVTERATVTKALQKMRDRTSVEIDTGAGRIFVPSSADDLAAILKAEPKATIVAGSTDVGLWVTKFMRDITPAVFIAHLDDLQIITDDGEAITFGAGVTYTDAFEALKARIPQMAVLIDRIGGEQIRNMGTIGGNIANGSPIGDTPPPLIALGATLTLRNGDSRRTIALEDFFLDYGKQDRAPGEFVESVTVPMPGAGAEFAVHKISKRRDEDITATLGAFYLERDISGVVTVIRIAFGGMAATPKRATHVEAALFGKPWGEEVVEAALAAFEADFTPLSDMRASAGYRMIVSKNLLRRFYLETTGAPVSISRFEAA